MVDFAIFPLVFLYSFFTHPFTGRNSMISDISRSTFRPGTDIFSVYFGVCVHRPHGGSFPKSEVAGLESHDIWYGFLVTWGLLVLFIICFFFFISVSCRAFCVFIFLYLVFWLCFLLTFSVDSVIEIPMGWIHGFLMLGLELPLAVFFDPSFGSPPLSHSFPPSRHSPRGVFHNCSYL